MLKNGAHITYVQFEQSAAAEFTNKTASQLEYSAREKD